MNYQEKEAKLEARLARGIITQQEFADAIARLRKAMQEESWERFGSETAKMVGEP